MSYRFLIVNDDYGESMEPLYRDNPGLWARPFDEQYAARMQTHFLFNNYYSSNLQKLGHKAIDLQCNNRFMQYAWVVENDLMPRKPEHSKEFIQSLPQDWLAAVFQAQIKTYKPDVIVDITMNPITWKALDVVKPEVPLIIGQYSSPVFHKMENMSVYDMFITPCHKYIDRFYEAGKICEYIKLGFESTLLDSIDTSDRPIDVAFVGGFTVHHTKGTDLFNSLAAQGISMDLYGYAQESLSPQARKSFRGECFGIDMFKIYSKAKIVINRHTNVANSVGNMRLYEATGMGACLLTDDLKGLDLLFAPGKEVATYSSHQHCAERIRYYLEHEDERKQIALNGQRRTLSEHTYYHRMTKFADIADYYLRKGRRSPNKHTVSLPNTVNPQKDVDTSNLPVLVYQPGKVGSKTIERSLTRNGIPSISTHFLSWEKVLSDIKTRLNQKELNRTQYAIRRMIDLAPANVRWKVITLVREPIARACSATVQNKDRFFPHLVGQPEEQMFNAVMDRSYGYLKGLDTKEAYTDTWFDGELKDVFGYDIFSVPFDRSQGFQIYKTPRADILLFKLEQLSECFQKAFSLFFGRPITQLHNTNVTRDKSDAQMYDRAKRELKMSRRDLQQVYSKRYIKHFYTPDQIEGFIQRWVDTDQSLAKKEHSPFQLQIQSNI